MIIRRGRLIKKIISVFVICALMITIINIHPQKAYAYTLGTDVDGTISVKYTVDYTFYEYNKTNPSWRCDDWRLNKSTSFDVPVTVHITRDTNGKASYSVSLDKTSDWELKCWSYAPGVTEDQGSNIVLKGNAKFDWTASGSDNFSSIGYNTSSNKTVDLTSKGCTFNLTDFYDENPDWQVDKKIENVKRVDSITLKFTYPGLDLYTLTVNPNGGTVWGNGDSATSSSFTTKFVYGRKTFMGNKPTRDGYTFTGWSFSNGSGGKNTDGETFYFSDTGSSSSNTDSYIFNGDYKGNVTATAHWQINKYPVIVEHYIMDTNGNYSSKPDKTVKGVNGQEKYNYNTEILSTACIDKSLLVTGGIEYDSDKTPEKTTVTADSNGTVIRIYYKRLKHTVTFNVIENGGYWKDNASNTNRTISVYYGNAYSSSSFDNIAVKGSNFDFKGWNTKYDTTDASKSLNTKMGTGDITYYAIYSKDIATTFVDSQGARTVNTTIWNKDTRGVITVPAIRAYNWKDTTGCKPVGYNRISDINKDGAVSAQVADNSSLSVSDDATYYAVYTAKATLVYEPEQGTLKNSDSQITVDVFCNANDINNVRGAQIKLAYCDRNPVSHDGYNHTYDFANWESSLDGKTYDAGKTFTITKNIIMTAVWNETITPITYTIHFEKVLGEAVTNVPDDITAVYDKTVTIPDNVPVRTGFTFTGWALIENATTDIISPGSTVKNLTTTDNAVVNLYAQWKQRKLVIVKASSTMYNDTIIRRTAGDDEWYNSVGKLGIQDLKNYPDDKCVQVWKIDKNGNITQTK